MSTGFFTYTAGMGLAFIIIASMMMLYPKKYDPIEVEAFTVLYMIAVIYTISDGLRLWM
jgi:hypothetical protein